MSNRALSVHECYQIIINKFNDLEKKCTDAKTVVDIDLDEFLKPIAFVTASWTDESGQPIEECFIRHLKLIPHLTHHLQFGTFFKKVTVYLCLLARKCVAHTQFNIQLLFSWENLLRSVQDKRKYGIFLNTKSNIFQYFAQILAQPAAFSQQLTVLQILCSYISYDRANVLRRLGKIFDELVPGTNIDPAWSNIANSDAGRRMLLIEFNKRLDWGAVHDVPPIDAEIPIEAAELPMQRPLTQSAQVTKGQSHSARGNCLPRRAKRKVHPRSLRAAAHTAARNITFWSGLTPAQRSNLYQEYLNRFMK